MRCVPRLLLLVVSTAVAACQDSRFQEFDWLAEAPDVVNERLCDEAADPDGAPDTTFIHCAIEGDHFAAPPVAPRDELIVMAWNIERGFGLDAQIDLLLNDPEVPTPDVLLVSEADRGCRRTGFRDVTRDLAEALGYYYVYVVEFVELPGDRGETGPYDPPLCEHGNAIVARYPLGNVRQIRHAENWIWYTPPGFPNPDEPRLGGRIAVAADLLVGARRVRLYSLHLESTLSPVALAIRDAQALEVGRDAVGLPYPVVIGGDFNSYELLPALLQGGPDPTVAPVLDLGFADAHGALAPLDRITAIDIIFLVIDLLLVRGAETRDPGICPAALCDPVSDHRAVWTTLVLPHCDPGFDPTCDL